MEDYDRYMDERGHEACAQMLARNSAGDGAESLPALHISEDGMCARVEVDLLEHARAVIARRLAETEQAAFDEVLRDMGYVRIDGGTPPPTMPEQPPYDLLIDLLRDEWGIDVSWDLLRKFWYIGLTEKEVRVREQLEKENAELRKLVRDYDKVLDDAVYVWGTVVDFLGYGRKYDALHDRMRELGIEVEQ